MGDFEMRKAEQVQGLKETTVECNGSWLQWHPIHFIFKTFRATDEKS